MDSFNIANLKIEKSNTILRYRRLQKFTALLRFLEICLALVAISKLSSQLGGAFGISGDFFRRVSATLFSPRFVFVVGNAIVITLFINCNNHDRNRSKCTTDLYQEYVEIVEKNKEKQSMFCGGDDDSDSVKAKESMCDLKVEKIRRSCSENLRVEKPRRELRRSATAKAAAASEEMSSEEFRQTVEAFIARQQRFLREEEVSAVVSV